MPAYAPYKKEDDTSYALGVFPSMELLSTHPKALRALLVRGLDEPNEGLRKLLQACAAAGVRVEEAPRALKRVSGKDNCLAALVFAKYENTLAPNRDHVLLHNPSDVGNAGTILRAALAFGWHDVAIIRPGVDPFDPRVIRASMGAVFHLRVELFASFDDYLCRFPEGERQFCCFRLRNAAPLSAFRRTEAAPLTLLFGNEASGLPPSLETFGQGVWIEQSNQVDSLNLAVAAGIGLYTLRTPTHTQA